MSQQPTQVIQGSIAPIDTQWRDATNTLTDPSSHSIQIYDPTGAAYGSPVTNPTQLSTGHWQYIFQTPANALLGVWSWRWTGVVNSLNQVISGQFQVVLFITPPPIYGDVITVKELCNFSQNETGEDSRVLRAIAKATNLINNELQAWGQIVPLNPVPPIIADACNDWAAGIVNDEITTPSQNNALVIPTEGGGSRMNIFIVRAKKTLKDYIRTTYNTSGLTVTSASPYAS